VAVSNGTAALHAAIRALGIGPGDEVIVPAITFAATANAVLYEGGTPVFADVDPGTLLIDPRDVERKITPRTKAIAAVDYGGQPCDYDALDAIARSRKLAIVADACHALGGSYRGRAVGSLARLSTFSFHPVKPIATGEGGMIATDDPAAAEHMRRFRNHGISTDHRQREAQGAWFYEMVELGFNYRLTDIQCALGLSQLKKVPAWTRRRQAIARRYDEAFAGSRAVRPLAVRPEVEHAYHLYVVRVKDRDAAFLRFRDEGIGVNVHYVPVHLHPYYRERLGTREGMCPAAEAAYREILSLPIFAGMTDEDAADVLAAARKVCGA
jgi:perosamine synthetase